MFDAKLASMATGMQSGHEGSPSAWNRRCTLPGTEPTVRAADELGPQHHGVGRFVVTRHLHADERHRRGNVTRPEMKLGLV